MLKHIVLKGFQSFGIYVVYINLCRALASGEVVFDIDSALLPFFMTLAAVNAAFGKEESQYSPVLNNR